MIAIASHLASFSGDFRLAKNRLGTTVDACAFIPIKTWDIVYACILSVSCHCNCLFHVRLHCDIPIDTQEQSNLSTPSSTIADGRYPRRLKQ